MDTTEAVPSAKPLDTFCDTQTNDNFSIAEVDDSPVNRQTSEVFNKTPPKLNKQKAAQSKTTSNESRKRVQLGAPKNPSKAPLLHATQFELTQSLFSNRSRV